jgi:hypothetical protein
VYCCVQVRIEDIDILRAIWPDVDVTSAAHMHRALECTATGDVTITAGAITAFAPQP